MDEVPMTSRKLWKVVAAAAFMALGFSVLLAAGPLQAASGLQMQDGSPTRPSTHGGDRDMQHMMNGMSMEEMMFHDG